MAYDGFYSALSTRATVNEILNLAIQTKDEIVAQVEAFADLVSDATDAANLAANSASAAAASEAIAQQAAVDAQAALAAMLPDAPSDGSLYGRKDGAWSLVSGAGGVEEAPEDGTPYARQDASWVPVGGSGGPKPWVILSTESTLDTETTPAGTDYFWSVNAPKTFQVLDPTLSSTGNGGVWDFKMGFNDGSPVNIDISQINPVNNTLQSGLFNGIKFTTTTFLDDINTDFFLNLDSFQVKTAYDVDNDGYILELNIQTQGHGDFESGETGWDPSELKWVPVGNGLVKVSGYVSWTLGSSTSAGVATVCEMTPPLFWTGSAKGTAVVQTSSGFQVVAVEFASSARGVNVDVPAGLTSGDTIHIEITVPVTSLVF